MSRKVGGREATAGVISGRYCLSVGKPDLPAPEGWSWRPLLEIARLESGHTPSRRKPEYWGGDVSWIGIRDATGNHGRTIHQTIQHTNELGIANSAARILPENTVCLSRTASVGYVVVMGKPMATSQDFANWVCGPELDYRFLKYALLTENEALHRFSYGSTHRTIYYPELKAFHVCVPERKKQEEIANTLQVLDDKIELNRKTAATLEELARALYRSWFVDFDPVHAKAAGRAPAHMDTQAADLFPDSFGDDGLPEGWEIGTLSDLMDFNPREKLPKGTLAPYLDMKALPTAGMSAEPPYDRAFTSGTKFRARDTLLARITPCLENGKTAMVDDLGAAEIGWGSTEFIVMRAKGSTPSSLPYCVARDARFREEAIASMTGSSGRQRADAKTIAAIKTAVPPEEIIVAFGQATMPMIEKVHQLGSENQTLATLRDMLLPRLMSGELRVGEAKEQVEEFA